jgi:hypothetical protein
LQRDVKLISPAQTENAANLAQALRMFPSSFSIIVEELIYGGVPISFEVLNGRQSGWLGARQAARLRDLIK